ncbi:hypothetical protein DFH09DRAFT_1184900 [Mycena vulgaris]|nr:hypothetical protein DFH09DRAFT_1184900 [Mycena vulgaris]
MQGTFRTDALSLSYRTVHVLISLFCPPTCSGVGSLCYRACNLQHLAISEPCLPSIGVVRAAFLIMPAPLRLTIIHGRYTPIQCKKLNAGRRMPRMKVQLRSGSHLHHITKSDCGSISCRSWPFDSGTAAFPRCGSRLQLFPLSLTHQRRGSTEFHLRRWILTLGP